MGFFDRISAGLERSRNKFKEQMNILLDRGPDLDDEFWDGLEESLILSDVGGPASADIVENLQDQARRKALPDAYAVLDYLYDTVADTFTPAEKDIFDNDEALVLFVGINGTGKTTTVGKIAKAEPDKGRKVILGSADTFRAAAIEQLEVWSKRANVEMVTRERGADPASVCYDTIERAEAIGADLVLIDTAGRLHTSNDLMRELEKVVKVVKKRSKYPVYSVLVIDATTGQNGLQQAREFNRALDLDGLIVTKLDGTAKGGIALAVSHDLELPIYKIGVGESIEDLRPFDAHDFARALIGDFDSRSKDAPHEAEEDVLAGEETQSQFEPDIPIDEEPEFEPEPEEQQEPTPVEELEEAENDVQPEFKAEEDSDSMAEVEEELELETAPEPEPEQPKRSFWQRLWNSDDMETVADSEDHPTADNDLDQEAKVDEAQESESDPDSVNETILEPDVGGADDLESESALAGDEDVEPESLSDEDADTEEDAEEEPEPEQPKRSFWQRLWS